MKAQVINTDFLHDGKYYSQNSIINVSPDLIKKYPNNLLTVIESSVDETKIEETKIDENVSSDLSDLSAVADVSEMIQDNSNANNMLVPSAELAPYAELVSKKVKKNKKLIKGRRT